MIAVVGGGVAGLQAGVFLARADLETVVFDTGESLVHNTSNIQNLVGHESVGGKELIESGKRKLEQFGGELREQEVEDVQRKGDSFLVSTDSGEFEAEYVVVASAGELGFLEGVNGVEFEEGVEGPYMMDRHVVTDEKNRAADGLFVAGLANSWEYQTSVALGDGAKAAVNLISEIEGEPYQDHST
jgi:thioredoxin reductase